MGNEWGKDHKGYDQQREIAKLEQQRQEALREAARRASSPDQAAKDMEALNAFYNRKVNAMPGSAGHKTKACASVLVAGAGGLAAAAAGIAAAARAFI